MLSCAHDPFDSDTLKGALSTLSPKPGEQSPKQSPSRKPKGNLGDSKRPRLLSPAAKRARGPETGGSASLGSPYMTDVFLEKENPRPFNLPPLAHTILKSCGTRNQTTVCETAEQHLLLICLVASELEMLWSTLSRRLHIAHIPSLRLRTFYMQPELFDVAVDIKAPYRCATPSRQSPATTSSASASASSPSASTSSPSASASSPSAAAAASTTGPNEPRTFDVWRAYYCNFVKAIGQLHDVDFKGLDGPLQKYGDTSASSSGSDPHSSPEHQAVAEDSLRGRTPTSS